MRKRRGREEEERRKRDEVRREKVEAFRFLTYFVVLPTHISVCRFLVNEGKWRYWTRGTSRCRKRITMQYVYFSIDKSFNCKLYYKNIHVPFAGYRTSLCVFSLFHYKT